MKSKPTNTRRGAVDICVIAAILCALLLAGPPEPETCALCGNGEGRPDHAPCLVECSTVLLAELADHFGVSIDYLVGRTDVR